MHDSGLSKTLLLTAGLGIAITAGACDRTTKSADETTPGAVGTSGVAASTISLSGCLQKGSGIHNFVLTQAIRPEAVGTSGSTPDRNTVPREQRDAAAKSYRLRGGDNDQLDTLVGKQVTVAGTIADRDSGDLPKLDVDQIVRVSEACGTQNPPQP